MVQGTRTRCVMSYALVDMKSTALERHQFTYLLLLLLLILGYLAGYGDAGGGGIPGVEISMAPSHVALSGHFHVQITSRSFPPLTLQLSRLEGNLAQPLLTMPVFPEAAALANNSTIVKIPCGYFSRGGEYYIRIRKQPVGPRNGSSLDFPSFSEEEEGLITRSLDVRWPMPQLSLTPERVETYPERPVAAILEFPEVVCPPAAGSPAAAIPEFWLELHYCGQSLLTCDVGDGKNSTNQVLYSEQVRGFPGRRVVNLRCELFGLAGHYALFLRPTGPSPGLPHTAAYVKVEWSEQFVFNVHARSIFPCDAHSGGVPVLFQYPSCILAEGDRVRLFARLRADVAAAQPPTTLEYVGEQKVSRGRHSLHFDCDLFTEKYVEYCFVYVSQAITGAVADVRMDCVPTMPVPDRDNGGWGAWSAWTPCSSTCIGGTRSRYRFCDSPPPKYGAKFCEGAAVETEKCGTSLGTGWECVYGIGASSVGGLVSEIAAEIPEVAAEVGPFCRCGCVVHLGRARPKRLLATSAQSCPGRTFWLIQAEDDHQIEFRVDQFRLPCGTQWLKVRDGASLSSTLIAALPDDDHAAVNSTGPQLLLEFYAEEDAAVNGACGGGFFAVATQLKSVRQNISSLQVAQSVGVVPAIVLKLTAVHIAAIFFLSGLIIATIALAAQYVVRYRKYHVAKAEDQDSLADPSGSNASLPMATRASSSATLLSEVISLTRLRPHVKPSRAKHTRLRESGEYESGKSQTEVTLAKEEEFPSDGSTATLTQPEAAVKSKDLDPPTSTSLPSSPQMTEQKTMMRRSSTLTSEKEKASEKEETPVMERVPARRYSNVSNATLTNGCYTSAASIVSRATIRSTNAKETKEKRNREKLMATGGPGSDFSITGQDTDLEMDYYDYNVVNAGAAPGSYLGMDPAFLVWIPPLDESGEILPEETGEYHEMEDIRPKLYIDPGSNKESPEQEMLLPKSDNGAAKIRILHHGVDNRLISEVEPLVHKSRDGVIQEFHRKQRAARENGEKETKVEKSPSLELDDIKYVDDEEEECNIDVSYQDSNIVSSS